MTMRRTPLLLLAILPLSACKLNLPPVDESADEGQVEAETGEPEGEEGVGEPPDEPGTTFVVPGDTIFGDCDPWLQDCVEGEKCVPYSSDGGPWNANRCVQVNGDGQPGDACSWAGISDGSDSCGASSHCWDVMEVDGQLQGVCTPFCQGSADSPQCGPNTACLIANEGSINLCVATCDPLTQDCGSGLGCFWANNNFQCIFTAGDILGGEPCGYINDCAPGHLCATADVLPACNGSACCTPFCDLVDPYCANPATQCAAFFEEGTAPPNYEGVGVCIMPGA
jgi:hypothetical protein